MAAPTSNNLVTFTQLVDSAGPTYNVGSYMPSVGANGKLVVYVSIKDNDTTWAVSGVTYASTAMTKVNSTLSDSGSSRVESSIWELDNPTGVASSGSVVITVDTTLTMDVIHSYAETMLGAAQNSPTAGEKAVANASSGNLSVNVTPDDVDNLIGSVAGVSSTSANITPDSPMSEDATNSGGSQLQSSVGHITTTTATLTAVGWQISAGNRRTMCAASFGPAAASGVDVAVPSKAYTITKNVPTVASGGGVVVPLKAFSLTKFAPSVFKDIEIPLKQFTFTGFTPGVFTSVNVIIPLKQFTLTGFVPAVGGTLVILVPSKSFNLNFNIPAVTIGANVVVPLKVFTIGKHIPLVGTGVNAVIPSKAFSLTGLVPVISTNTFSVFVPLKQFTLTKFIPSIHSIGVAQQNALDLDLTPPFGDISQSRYLHRNFDIVRNVLKEGFTGQFTTTDGKTVHVRNGVVIDMF